MKISAGRRDKDLGDLVGQGIDALDLVRHEDPDAAVRADDRPSRSGIGLCGCEGLVVDVVCPGWGTVGAGVVAGALIGAAVAAPPVVYGPPVVYAPPPPGYYAPPPPAYGSPQGTLPPK